MSRPGGTIPVVESPGPYVYFVLSAFALTLIGGPLVGLLAWRSTSGASGANQVSLLQAHGWAELVGWAGIFVAGFSLRLVPRFAGRPERSASIALVLLGLLVLGVVLRIAGGVGGGGLAWIGAAGGMVAAMGMLGVAISLVATLRINRRGAAPWSLFAWFGLGWWIVWAGLSALTGSWTSSSGTVPEALDRAGSWVVLLGAIGNFIWAVQSRMIPVSFGRRPLAVADVLVAAAGYNLGVLLVLASIATGYLAVPQAVTGTLMAAGLATSGAGMAVLAVTCGAVRGRPHRLRPASQHLGRYITWANRWALLAGLLLLIFSAGSALPPSFSRLELEDAAFHATGVGLVTILIAGMLQLVAPVFAMQRLADPSPPRTSVLVWTLLMTAAATRLVAALAHSIQPAWFAPLAGLSALTGWLGLALLLAAVIRPQLRLRAQAPNPG